MNGANDAPNWHKRHYRLFNDSGFHDEPINLEASNAELESLEGELAGVPRGPRGRSSGLQAPPATPEAAAGD